MNPLTVCVSIPVYKSAPETAIQIQSGSTILDEIRLNVGAKTYTVSASDLIRAIKAVTQ